jgi:hypothetical protein
MRLTTLLINIFYCFATQECSQSYHQYLEENSMSPRIVLISHRVKRPKLAAIGILLFIVAILLCVLTLTLSPVKAGMEDESRSALAQSEPTLDPSVQTAATIFLPLIANELNSQPVARSESPPIRVMASSDHNGNSETPPPTVNNHTFVADQGGRLDG